MRVALCLSGKYRNALECFDSIKKNIIDIHRPDIFISSWTNPKDVQHIMYDTQFSENDTNHTQICQMYNPISFELETYDSSIDGYFSRIIESTHPQSDEERDGCMRLLGQWYKRMRCNQLKQEWERKNGFLYDVVIVCRFDLQFFEPILVNTINPKTIKFASGYDWWGGLGDLFFWGSSPIVDKVCELFNHIPYYRLNYNKEHQDASKTLKFNNHIILSYYLSKNNIMLERFDSKIKLRNSFMLNVVAEKRWRVYDNENDYLYNTTLSHTEYIDNFNVVEREFYEDRFYSYFGTGTIWEGWGCQIKEQDIVIDLGAGYGFFSYRVSEKASRVYSLEQDPHLFSCLTNNIIDRENIIPLRYSKNIDWMKLFDFLNIERVNFFRISSLIEPIEVLKTIPVEILDKIETIVFESDNQEACYSLNIGFGIKNYFYNLESGSLRLFNYFKK